MKRFFSKVDLFGPSLEAEEAVIPCSFDFDLEKKKIVEDNRTIIFFLA